MTEEADRVNESSKVQLLVAAEDAFLVEGDAAVAREIGLDVGPRGDAVMQIDHARYLALERLHALWKCVAQALDDLEQREIGVSRPAAGEIGPAIVLQQPLEIAQIFRHAVVPEFLGAFFRRL